MTWPETLVISILFIYTILIFVTVFVLLFSKEENELHEFIPTEKISIIIPFRDEAKSISACLEEIITQDYPIELMELILVDDSSDDNSKQIAENLLKTKTISFTVIDLKANNLSGKKNAIELAVSQSSGSIVITRDADTFTKNDLWLKNMAYQFKKTNADLILAPVILIGTTFIQSFQQFENMAITSMGYAFAKIDLPFVCSGANLAYKKDSFLKANPYKNNKHIPSGDDMFLLQSFLNNGSLISSTKNLNTLIYTNAEKKLSSFINQRLRWASKAKHLHIKTAWIIGAALFLSNLILLITVVYTFFGGINNRFCLFALIYKCIIEFLLLFLGRFMYRQKLKFTYYLPAFIANLFYVPAISVISIFIKPNWKGRKQGV